MDEISMNIKTDVSGKKAIACVVIFLALLAITDESYAESNTKELALLIATKIAAALDKHGQGNANARSKIVSRSFSCAGAFAVIIPKIEKREPTKSEKQMHNFYIYVGEYLIADMENATKNKITNLSRKELATLIDKYSRERLAHFIMSCQKFANPNKIEYMVLDFVD